MVIQQEVLAHPYTYLGIASTICALLFTLYSYRSKRSVAAREFTVFMGFVTIWTSGTLFMMIMSPDYQHYAFLYKSIGEIFVPLAWLMFCISYANYSDYLSLPNVWALSIIPSLLLLIIWISPEPYMYENVAFLESGPITVLSVEDGILRVVQYVYIFSYVIGGYIFLLDAYKTGQTIQRKQGLLIAGAALIMTIGAVASIFSTHPYPEIQLAPFMFSIATVFFVWAFYGYDFLDIVPIARHRVVEEISDPIFVIESSGRIVDLNRSANSLVEQIMQNAYSNNTYDVNDVVGRQISTAVPEIQFEDYNNSTQLSRELTVEANRKKHFSLNSVPLFSSEGIKMGNVIMLNDITEQENKRLELERQNERLDKFASVISHDLRNPLNMAQGYADLAKKNPTTQNIERMEMGLDRMENMIDDLLTLAREGQSVTTKENISLGRLVDKSWDSVDTKEATLINNVENMVVNADSERLRRCCENLFRNAIEHNKNTVTIEVGRTNSGFYVADDGDGIPEKNQEHIFEYGETFSEDGTGLGLAIVRNIIHAHGWEIEINNEWDGARFDIMIPSGERNQQNSENE